MPKKTRTSRRYVPFASPASIRSSYRPSFDFVVDLGRELPMRTIGMLPAYRILREPSVRAEAHRVLRNEPGKPLPVDKDHYFEW